MSFWKNPEYKALRMVIALVVLVAIAYFAVSAKKSNSLDQSGKVINQSTTTTKADPSGYRNCNVEAAFYENQTDGCDVQFADCHVTVGYPASNSSGEPCCVIQTGSTGGNCYTADGQYTVVGSLPSNKKPLDETKK